MERFAMLGDGVQVAVMCCYLVRVGIFFLENIVQPMVIIVSGD
jgi:hypothetical protein